MQICKYNLKTVILRFFNKNPYNPLVSREESLDLPYVLQSLQFRVYSFKPSA